MANNDSELVFAALGGLGEIGMNAALYGYGPASKRKWLMVDCGLAFAGPDLPGVDILVPDISFIDKIKRDLVGLVITHAHEDHIGGIAALWSRLGCPVYATPFAASLLETKRLAEPGAPQVPLMRVAQGARLALAPFDIEFIAMAHSIPESCALAIRTPAGLVLHSGDWKIDPAPGVGLPTDEARLKEIGDEGVLAMISDSTNIMRDGQSPSEADVAATLEDVMRHAKGRVVVTTFASNVARIRAVALAAQACGRSVVIAGRALDRVNDVARECGLLDGVLPFFSPDVFSDLARDRIVVLATGSQGEPRAAMARVAVNDHPVIKLAPGDTAIFSSRTIPGNEREVNRIINALIDQGVEVVTDRTALVHCSGHPRRDEVAKLYSLVRPQIAIPAHGEPQHLSEHMRFARAQGVLHVIGARNGDVVLLGPATPGIVDEIKHGRMAQDGSILLSTNDESLRARVRLSQSGVISVAMAVTGKGELAGDPDVVLAGVPARTNDGRQIDELVDAAIFETFDALPRGRRRDADAVSNAVERAVKNTLYAAWGKRPLVHVLVVEV